MATGRVIDHLLIELNLDASKFEQGQKKAAESFLKTYQAAAEQGKKTTDVMTQVEDSLMSMARRFLALAGAIEIAKKVGEFAEKTTKMSISLENLSRVTGISVRELSRWEMAAERAGASAQSMRGTISSVTRDLQDLQAGGGGGNLSAVLGTINTYAKEAGQKGVDFYGSDGKVKRATELITEMVDAMERFKVPQDNRIAMLRKIGASGDVIAVLTNAKTKFSDLIEQQKSIAEVTDKDVEAANKLNEAWQRLSQSSDQLGRKILDNIVEPLVKAVNAMTWLIQNQILRQQDHNAAYYAEHPEDLKVLQEFLGEKAYNTYAKTKNLPPYGQTEAPAGGGAPGGGGSAPHAMPRSDVQGGGPASVRYNNPGAQYPSKEAARFGGNGYGVIGGGHLIQKFDDPVHGAASNMDLFYRKYTGEPLGQAGARWTGNNSFGVPGFPSNMIVTKEMMADKKFGIALMQAIAKRETGHAYPMTDAQWEAAHRLFMESTTSKGAPGGGGNIDKALDAMRQKDQSQIPWLSNPRLIRSPRYQQSYDGTKNYSTSETNVHSLIVNGGAKPMVTDDAYGVARDTVPALDRGQKVIQSTQGAN